MKRFVAGLRLVGLVVLLAGLSGCGDEETVDGPYVLIATDGAANSRLAYDLGDGASIGRIGPDVYAVGFDSEYLVVARHPYPFGQARPSEGTEFFYLVRKLDRPGADPSESVRGPFDRERFYAEKRRLKLPEFSVWVMQPHYE